MTNLVGPALTMTDISVSYGPTVALENASIEVPAGAVMGFIGPNGAGKSTLINLRSIS